MNEEAGFIAALLAEPGDYTAMLVYADWLDERADPRAAYLRMIATGAYDHERLNALDRVLNLGWLHLISSRRLKPGDRTQYKAPNDTDAVLDQTTITAERPGATVRLTIRHRRGTANFGWWELEVLPRSAGCP